MRSLWISLMLCIQISLMLPLKQKCRHQQMSLQKSYPKASLMTQNWMRRWCLNAVILFLIDFYCSDNVCWCWCKKQMPLAVIVAALSVLQQLSTNNTSYTLCQKDVRFLFFKQLCQKLTKFYRASSYACNTRALWHALQMFWYHDHWYSDTNNAWLAAVSC